MPSRRISSGIGPGGRQEGFTLLEVLVALVIIAVGMLGVAVLYVEGMKAERTSVYRTTAVNLVADLADRIRANPTGTGAYAGAAIAETPAAAAEAWRNCRRFGLGIVDLLFAGWDGGEWSVAAPS